MRKKKVASGVLIIALIATCFSGCLEFDEAYVSPTVLTNGWCENKTAYDSGSQNFGLEKWVTIMYQVGGEYPGSLQVGTIKTLMLLGEDKLLKKVMDNILDEAEQEGIHVDEKSKVEGTRKILKLHETKFFTFMGIVTEKRRLFDRNESVMIIGEVWSCAESGVSVICVGFAQITRHGPFGLLQYWDTGTWKKIVGDPYGTFKDLHPSNEGKGLYGSGLIYNVICH